MKFLLSLLCIVYFNPISSSAYPYNAYHRPQRTVMFGGYYGHNPSSKSYIPEGSMTAFASGDTIATNSFVGDDFASENQHEFDSSSVEETTEKRKSVQQYHPEPSNPNLDDDDVRVIETELKSKKVPKRKPQKPVQTDEDNDDDEIPANWPFLAGRNGAPSYNAFFPIMFGGGSHGGSKTRSSGLNDEYYPGSATAIANSFSTGKGGVATSHATSFGDPYLSSLFRNGFLNRKAKPEQNK